MSHERLIERLEQAAGGYYFTDSSVAKLLRDAAEALRGARASEGETPLLWEDVEFAVGYCCGKGRVDEVWEAIVERQQRRKAGVR